MPAGRHLALATLGSASLSIAGSSTVLGPGKLLALLIYLACAPGRGVRTDELLDLFWPRQDRASGHHDLRQAVWQLRRRLGGGAVVSTGNTLALQAPIVLDRDEFLGALERGDPGRAVSAYGGNFLVGLSAPQAVGFDQWVDGERYRLLRLFVRAAERVTRDWLARGQFLEAQRLAQRVRDTDPESETGWVLVLETLVVAGEAARAAAEADVLEWLSSAESRPLGQATRALLDRARTLNGR